MDLTYSICVSRRQPEVTGSSVPFSAASNSTRLSSKRMNLSRDMIQDNFREENVNEYDKRNPSSVKCEFFIECKYSSVQVNSWML